MNQEMHTRAEQWIAKERIEGLSETERDSLRTHLEECASCADAAKKTEEALRSLRTLHVSLPSGLASRTQFRVQLRLQELREREPKRRALWAACAFSWAFGIASAPYVWRLFQWFGERAGVPKLVWQFGFGLWWTIPALFVVVVLLMEKLPQGGEPVWMRQSR
jgi:hypothetical protein